MYISQLACNLIYWFDDVLKRNNSENAKCLCLESILYCPGKAGSLSTSSLSDITQTRTDVSQSKHHCMGHTPFKRNSITGNYR